MLATNDRGDHVSVAHPGIARLLKERLLTVPEYQRDYAWQQQQIADYWNDLSGALQLNDPSYFLGTVVVTREDSPGRLNVVDGQQRLATTAILIAAIRDAYIRGNELRRASTVEFEYLLGRDLETDLPEPKLILNAEDNPYFAQKIIPSPADKVDSRSSRSSHSRMDEAVRYFRDRIDELISVSGSNWTRALSKWINFLTEGAIVIVVEVADETSAFTIFETLNDRGLDLTIADLVKNHLFKTADRRDLAAVKNAWTSAAALLDANNDPKTFTTFLRQYWSSRYGVARERQLFKELKEQISSAPLALQFTSDLNNAAQYFAALLNSDHDFWTPFGTATQADIETLLRFGLEQNRPMLMAAMQYLPKRELKKLIKASVAWSVRGLVAGGIGGGATERAYSNAGIQIRNGTLKSANDVFGELSNSIPTDRDFAEAFEILRDNRAKYNRYYLRELEMFVQKQTEPEWVPNRDEAEINLEHVYPRNAVASDWPQFPDSDESQELLWRLGNLVLLPKTPNSHLGNKSFSGKKSTLAKSDFKLTRTVSEFADWTPQSIRERQKYLASLAPDVWRRSP